MTNYSSSLMNMWSNFDKGPLLALGGVESLCCGTGLATMPEGNLIAAGGAVNNIGSPPADFFVAEPYHGLIVNQVGGKMWNKGAHVVNLGGECINIKGRTDNYGGNVVCVSGVVHNHGGRVVNLATGALHDVPLSPRRLKATGLSLPPPPPTIQGDGASERTRGSDSRHKTPFSSSSSARYFHQPPEAQRTVQEHYTNTSLHRSCSSSSSSVAPSRGGSQGGIISLSLPSLAGGSTPLQSGIGDERRRAETSAARGSHGVQHQHQRHQHHHQRAMAGSPLLLAAESECERGQQQAARTPFRPTIEEQTAASSLPPPAAPKIWREHARVPPSSRRESGSTFFNPPPSLGGAPCGHHRPGCVALEAEPKPAGEPAYTGDVQIGRSTTMTTTTTMSRSMMTETVSRLWDAVEVPRHGQPACRAGEDGDIENRHPQRDGTPLGVQRDGTPLGVPNTYESSTHAPPRLTSPNNLLMLRDSKRGHAKSGDVDRGVPGCVAYGADHAITPPPRVRSLRAGLGCLASRQNALLSVQHPLSESAVSCRSSMSPGDPGEEISL